MRNKKVQLLGNLMENNFASSHCPLLDYRSEIFNNPHTMAEMVKLQMHEKLGYTLVYKRWLKAIKMDILDL